jgi:hypothetical protein
MKVQFRRQLFAMSIAARQTLIVSFLLRDLELALIRIKSFIFCESDAFYQTDLTIAARKSNPFLRTCEVVYKLVANIPTVKIRIRLPQNVRLIFEVCEAELVCRRFIENNLSSTVITLLNFCIY